MTPCNSKTNAVFYKYLSLSAIFLTLVQTTTYAPKIPFSYVVYNKIGQALLQGKSDDGSIVQFNTDTLPPGQYFVHIMFGSNTIEKQIFISH